MPEKPSAEATVTATGHVSLRGEVDMTTAPAATATMLAAVEADVQRVVIDLSQLTFLDATGLRSLMAANDAARVRDTQLVLSGCSPVVLRMLDITGVRDEFLVDSSDRQQAR